MIMLMIESILCFVNLITSIIQIGSLIIWFPYLYLIYLAAAESKQGTPLGKKLAFICALIFVLSAGIGLLVAHQLVNVLFWKVVVNLIAGSVLLYYVMHWQDSKDSTQMIWNKENDQFKR